MQKIPLKRIRTLDPISSASGLVILKNNFFIIADDRLDLAMFSLNTQVSIKYYPLFEGTLPDDYKARKKAKPDLESLSYLPMLNSLLALPSGSKDKRMKGSLINVDQTLSIPIDCSPLYLNLLKTFSELNMEGAVVFGQELKLFQRGNGELAQNAIISLNLNKVLDELKRTKSMSSDLILKIKNYDLGLLKDVPLSFTDAAINELNNQLSDIRVG